MRRRVLVLVPLLVLVSMGVFVLADASPFDPLLAYLGDRYQLASAEQRAEMAGALGFDQGWWAGWTAWAGDLAGG